MTEMNGYAAHQFSWADLMTTDADGAKEFYSGLFGWDVRDTPMPQGGSYTQFYLRGRNVCGCGEMNAEQQKEKVPPVWTSYVNVDNVDATAKHITEHGGRLVMPPMDVMAEGRMCVFADPTGAMLGLWQPKKHLGAGLYNEPGAFCWFELMTRDVEGAKKFYGSVFGWRYKDSATGDSPYSEIEVSPDVWVGGMMPVPPSLDVPNAWTPYFAVTDARASAKKAGVLGGTVLKEPTDIERVGTFAVISDPQGAVFDLLEYHPIPR